MGNNEMDVEHLLMKYETRNSKQPSVAESYLLGELSKVGR